MLSVTVPERLGESVSASGRKPPMSQPLPATAQGGWNAHHIIRRAVALLAVLMVAVLSACSSPPPAPWTTHFRA